MCLLHSAKKEILDTPLEKVRNCAYWHGLLHSAPLNKEIFTMKFVFLGLIAAYVSFNVSALDCSRMTKQLKCSTYSFKSNYSEVKKEAAREKIAAFTLRETGEPSESFCEASINLNDDQYGINILAYSSENNMVSIYLKKVGSDVKAQAFAELGIGQKLYAVLAFNQPLVGTGADTGFKVYQVTMACELTEKF